METRGRTQEDWNRNRSGDGNESSTGDGNGNGTGTGTKTGLGRAEERRRSARNRTRVVAAIWEMMEIWVRREKNNRSLGSVAVDPDNLENIKEAGRKAQDTQRTVQVDRVCPRCRV